jgi:cation diffusion facilitator family transporter
MPAPRLQRLMFLSVLAALLTIGLKSVAYYVTGSVGLLSDAAESLVNLVAALTALLSLWYAARPVDSSHTYGHEKIEFFSSGLEGALIFAAAGGIAWYAVYRLLRPQPLEALDLGTPIAVAAALVNLAVGRVLLRAGRRAESIAVEAHGRHLLTDVWTTAGVVAGVGAVWLTGRLWLDPVVALVLAANLFRTGFDLGRRSFHGLMDRALPAEEQAAVRAAIEQHLEPGMDYHALRTRRAGPRRFADFHLLVPGVYTVHRAHEITNRIEGAIRAAFPDMEVTVHIEPIEERSAWEDSALVPLEQAAREGRRPEEK